MTIDLAATIATRSYLMSGTQHLARALAYHHTGSHGVASGHARQDGPIRDAKILDAIDPQLRIDH
jgi:hypothetical protein